MNTLGDLKAICNDYRVDLKTRKIAYGLHKTNRRAAFEYVRGFTRRVYIERQKVGPTY